MTAWERLIGVELDPWEAATLRRLSIQYANMRHEAKESGCPAPFAEDDPEQVQQRVDAQFAQMMKAFARKPKGGK